MMSTFDYGNTRLRARFPQLLMKEMLEEMTRAENLDGFLSLLIKSSYKASIEKALTYSGGIQAVHAIVELEVEKLYKDYRTFYTDSTWDQIELLFAYNDLKNLHTIVRGILGGVSYREIQELLDRSGTIAIRTLQELARCKNVNELVMKMTAFHLPFADALLKNQTALFSMQGVQIELLLEKEFYENYLRSKKNILHRSKLLKEYFDMNADRENIICVLRMIHYRDMIIHNELNMKDCILNAGTVSQNMLFSAANEPDIVRAIHHFEGSRYFPSLQEGFRAYQKTGLLAEFEERLRKLLLEWESRYAFRDPIDIGVPISYLVRKQNEMQNLWWIAKGIQLGFDSVDIIEHLEILQ
ncbi:MAG: V-type ATPase subunit [Pelolinea sp.]|jgi:vacuolar-type H+-ATPase subunit C/Vma6|nr:V-type ATPase subunit [Pelolinea sp.]